MPNSETIGPTVQSSMHSPLRFQPAACPSPPATSEKNRGGWRRVFFDATLLHLTLERWSHYSPAPTWQQSPTSPKWYLRSLCPEIWPAPQPHHSVCLHGLCLR